MTILFYLHHTIRISPLRICFGKSERIFSNQLFSPEISEQKLKRAHVENLAVAHLPQFELVSFRCLSTKEMHSVLIPACQRLKYIRTSLRRECREERAVWKFGFFLPLALSNNILDTR
jgi:hypothetical protein